MLINASLRVFQVARDCSDILATGHVVSGLYTVHVNDHDIDVYCDMTTEAGGWLVSDYSQINRFSTSVCQDRR